MDVEAHLKLELVSKIVFFLFFVVFFCLSCLKTYIIDHVVFGILTLHPFPNSNTNSCMQKWAKFVTLTPTCIPRQNSKNGQILYNYWKNGQNVLLWPPFPVKKIKNGQNMWLWPPSAGKILKMVKFLLRMHDKLFVAFSICYTLYYIRNLVTILALEVS